MRPDQVIQTHDLHRLENMLGEREGVKPPRTKRRAARAAQIEDTAHAT